MGLVFGQTGLFAGVSHIGKNTVLRMLFGRNLMKNKGEFILSVVFSFSRCYCLFPEWNQRVALRFPSMF